MQWVSGITVGKSSYKCVLIALANYHHDVKNECTPSISTLVSFTELNRKTVLAAIRWLENEALISTSKVRGTFSKYVLHMDQSGPKNGTAQRSDTSTNFGTSQPSDEEQTSTKNGTAPVPNLGPVPKTVPVPKTDTDQYQKRPGPVPNLGHKQDNGLEQDITPLTFPPEENATSEHSPTDEQSDDLFDPPDQPAKKPKQKFMARNITLPAEIDPAVWSEWCEFRSKSRKPITELAARKQIGLLRKYPQAVQAQIVDRSIQNDYQGLFEPREQNHGNANQHRKLSLVEQQYAELAKLSQP